MKVSVVGTGYLGTTHAAAMAQLGHEVVGVDVDADRIARLDAGEAPFYEPGLEQLLRAQVRDGALRFTTDLRTAAGFADVHFVCVGTPQSPDGLAADLRQVDAAFAELAAHLRPGATVVGKSTVPVGTAARLAQPIEAAGGALVWNPEFLREGLAVQDTLRPDRIVLGLKDGAGREPVEQVYTPILADGQVPLVVTDYATAELVKVAANSFLATKISFINAMAEVCERTGADVVALAGALGHDPRIGPHFLRAGLGFGGGCLPKDVRGFIAHAGTLDAGDATELLTAVHEINLRRPTRIVELASSLCGGELDGRRVAVLGLAFKPDSDDVRDSPALHVAQALRRSGAEVRAYDPQAVPTARRIDPALTYAVDVHDACRDADLVLHLTEWREFRELDPAALATLVGSARILDARNALDAEAWRAAGWQYHAPGRPGGQ